MLKYHSKFQMLHGILDKISNQKKVPHFNLLQLFILSLLLETKSKPLHTKNAVILNK